MIELMEDGKHILFERIQVCCQAVVFGQCFLHLYLGVLREKVPGPSNPMSNPLAMMDMMKGYI